MGEFKQYQCLTTKWYSVNVYWMCTQADTLRSMDHSKPNWKGRSPKNGVAVVAEAEFDVF